MRQNIRKIVVARFNSDGTQGPSTPGIWGKKIGVGVWDIYCDPNLNIQHGVGQIFGTQGFLNIYPPGTSGAPAPNVFRMGSYNTSAAAIDIGFTFVGYGV